MSITVIIPTYNHASTIEKTVQSVLSQAPEGSPLYNQVSVIVCDDASNDDTVAVVRRLSQDDDRISLIASSKNQGTLLNRKHGVLAATTPWVMLMDADDELAPGALERLFQEAQSDPAQILHFGVEVVAENEAAREAASGMEHFLTPPPRWLQDDAILTTQLAESGGFDWHMHHKLFDRELLQQAYRAAADSFLILSDDIYLCFIVDSLAHSYRAIPQSPWYLYHLGAGDTFGNAMDLKHLSVLAHAEADAYKLMIEFAKSNHAPARTDWKERLEDARDRILFHTMNEWHDNLPDEDKEEGIAIVIQAWQQTDGLSTIAAELWRFVRDEAYALWTTEDRSSPQARARKECIDSLLATIKTLEDHPSFASMHNDRCRTMKTVALGHLKDLAVWPNYLPEKQESHANSQGGPDPSPVARTVTTWLYKMRHAAAKFLRHDR